MSLKKHLAPVFVTGILISLLACHSKKQEGHTAFTRTDSLTDIYLVLQDSMLDTWNMMIKDDNKKIKAMKSLLHELQIGGQYTPAEIEVYEQRVDQLCRIRYTPKTMWNADVVEEYDFASESLVSELIALAEGYTAFSYNTTLQKLVEEIRAADLRVENYRADYDAVAMKYNSFIEENKDLLKEIADNGTLDKKPLFQVASE
ncbi:MAG TPA: LemA family protein [Cyclobacteriaceae bacterium]